MAGFPDKRIIIATHDPAPGNTSARTCFHACSAPPIPERRQMQRPGAAPAWRSRQIRRCRICLVEPGRRRISGSAPGRPSRPELPAGASDPAALKLLSRGGECRRHLLIPNREIDFRGAPLRPFARAPSVPSPPWGRRWPGGPDEGRIGRAFPSSVSLRLPPSPCPGEKGRHSISRFGMMS